MIDLEKMAKEHEKLFPNATLESQVWKLEEEIKELLEAIKEGDAVGEIKEAADIIIVAGGLYRWCPNVAKTIVDHFWITGAIESEVNRKWKINLKRKWEWNGKTYHHIGDE